MLIGSPIPCCDSQPALDCGLLPTALRESLGVQATLEKGGVGLWCDRTWPRRLVQIRPRAQEALCQDSSSQHVTAFYAVHAWRDLRIRKQSLHEHDPRVCPVLRRNN